MKTKTRQRFSFKRIGTDQESGYLLMPGEARSIIERLDDGRNVREEFFYWTGYREESIQLDTIRLIIEYVQINQNPE